MQHTRGLESVTMTRFALKKTSKTSYSRITTPTPPTPYHTFSNFQSGRGPFEQVSHAPMRARVLCRETNSSVPGAVTNDFFWRSWIFPKIHDDVFNSVSTSKRTTDLVLQKTSEVLAFNFSEPRYQFSKMCLVEHHDRLLTSENVETLFLNNNN